VAGGPCVLSIQYSCKLLGAASSFCVVMIESPTICYELNENEIGPKGNGKYVEDGEYG
jgi:hypothetical protein